LWLPDCAQSLIFCGSGHFVDVLSNRHGHGIRVFKRLGRFLNDDGLHCVVVDVPLDRQQRLVYFNGGRWGEGGFVLEIEVDLNLQYFFVNGGLVDVGSDGLRGLYILQLILMDKGLLAGSDQIESFQDLCYCHPFVAVYF
jgi:hypothetical protein